MLQCLETTWSMSCLISLFFPASKRVERTELDASTLHIPQCLQGTFGIGLHSPVFASRCSSDSPATRIYRRRLAERLRMCHDQKGSLLPNGWLRGHCNAKLAEINVVSTELTDANYSNTVRK